MLKRTKEDEKIDGYKIGRFAKLLLKEGYIKYKNRKFYRTDKPVKPFNKIIEIHDFIQLAIEKDIPFRSKDIQKIMQVRYTVIIEYLRKLRKQGKLVRKNFTYYKSNSRYLNEKNND